MYIAQIHPRLKFEDVKKDVLCELKISPDLSETSHPTDEEIDFIRRFSPAAASGRHLAIELMIAKVMKQNK